MTDCSPSNSRSRAGFTLVELLAVMAILGLLVGLSLVGVNKFRAMGYETACKANLRSIATTMSNYVDSRCDGRWPKQRGPKFLLQMVRDDFVQDKELNVFLCPGTQDSTRKTDSDPPNSGIKNFEEIDPDCISYAGRDNVSFPLQKDRLSEEPVASDDNWTAGQGRANHSGATIVVYADGHVAVIQPSQYKSELPEKQKWIPVGPTSPDEDLRKLLVE
jgi:prepilin-type N-terminal cleavage/methylation domain-containing protein/prepilin-type processing-associated H-X9-DG protein